YALDFGVLGYLYVNAPGAADYNFVEFKAAASRAIGPATLGAAVYYSPDFYGADEQATYVEANAAYAIGSRWTLSGAVGHQSLDVGDDYVTWNAGAAFALTDNIALDVRYHDTDVDGVLSDDRVVAGLKLSF
ncbi:MAG TPA: TorF family putative porin, partial [Brevundimonas sp.]|nr:TorF family putative porin [Brevundimonas sp.]